MNIPYIEIFSADWMIDYKPLKPTGRWKIESGPHYENRMFIEHQGFIFKEWISEHRIEFLPAKESRIFECEG
jgi:hypothetical protein